MREREFEKKKKKNSEESAPSMRKVDCCCCCCFTSSCSFRVGILSFLLISFVKGLAGNPEKAFECLIRLADVHSESKLSRPCVFATNDRRDDVK